MVNYTGIWACLVLPLHNRDEQASHMAGDNNKSSMSLKQSFELCSASPFSLDSIPFSRICILLDSYNWVETQSRIFSSSCVTFAFSGEDINDMILRIRVQHNYFEVRKNALCQGKKIPITISFMELWFFLTTISVSLAVLHKWQQAFHWIPSWLSRSLVRGPLYHISILTFRCNIILYLLFAKSPCFSSLFSYFNQSAPWCGVSTQSF